MNIRHVILGTALIAGIAAPACAQLPSVPRVPGPVDPRDLDPRNGPTVWRACADEIVTKERPAPRDIARRAAQDDPSANGSENPALYMPAELAAGAYEIYHAFADGEDTYDAFPHDELDLVGFLYGTAGLHTERRGRGPGERTLYGYVAKAKDGSRTFVVLRGTMEPEEWVRNAQVIQVPFLASIRQRAVANVHSGFLAIYSSLELETEDGAKSFRDAMEDGDLGDGPVTMTGHSLGGAVVSLAGVEAARKKWVTPEDLHLVTVASPRVGDRGFRRISTRVGRIDRICNMVDIVPQVPTTTKRLEYVHIGSLRTYSSYDYPDVLETEELSRGESINCWHSSDVYAWMLGHDHAGRGSEACWVGSVEEEALEE